LPEVRAVAAAALRGVDVGPAEQLLTRALAVDPDAETPLIE
jgi:hypothetical protein